MTSREREAELEALAAQHATSSEEDETAEWTVDEGNTATGTTTMTIRLPVRVVAALKRAAEEEGIGATVLARRFITEGLARDPDLDLETTTGVVVDLVRHLEEGLKRASQQESRRPQRPASDSRRSGDG